MPKHDWQIMIVEVSTIRHHRMDGAPDWVIRNENGYYYSDPLIKLIYAGDWEYEQYETGNN